MRLLTRTRRCQTTTSATSAEQLALIEVTAKFFLDEADPIRNNKPRLDILLRFEDASWIRYHPDTALITSKDTVDTNDMILRKLRQKKQEAKHNEQNRVCV